MKTKTLIPLILLILTSCATVPTTTIRVDPSKKTVEVSSPKDVLVEGFNFTMFPTATGTVVTATIDKYESRNNIDAIKAVVDQNLATQEKIVDGTKKVVGFLIDHAK